MSMNSFCSPARAYAVPVDQKPNPAVCPGEAHYSVRSAAQGMNCSAAVRKAALHEVE